MTENTHLRQVTLLQRLLELTKDSKLDWEKVGKSLYVSFSNYSVRVGETGQDNQDVYIAILNQDGEVADSFTDVDLKQADPNGRDFFGPMKELLNMARRKALGADQALDELLLELGKK